MVCEHNPSIDENNVKFVLRNDRQHWREKLRSLRIHLSPLNDLIPVQIGDVVIENCAGTGVNIIVTKRVGKAK